MAGQDLAKAPVKDPASRKASERSDGPVLASGRRAFDKSQSAPRSGSVGMVLLIALLLIVAGVVAYALLVGF